MAPVSRLHQVLRAGIANAVGVTPPPQPAFPGNVPAPPLQNFPSDEWGSILKKALLEESAWGGSAVDCATLQKLLESASTIEQLENVAREIARVLVDWNGVTGLRLDSNHPDLSSHSLDPDLSSHATFFATPTTWVQRLKLWCFFESALSVEETSAAIGRGALFKKFEDGYPDHGVGVKINQQQSTGMKYVSYYARFVVGDYYYKEYTWETELSYRAHSYRLRNALQKAPFNLVPDDDNRYDFLPFRTTQHAVVNLETALERNESRYDSIPEFDTGHHYTSTQIENMYARFEAGDIAPNTVIYRTPLEGTDNSPMMNSLLPDSLLEALGQQEDAGGAF